MVLNRLYNLMIQIQYGDDAEMQRYDKLVDDTLILFKKLYPPDPSWTLRESKNGYQIHTKPDPDSGLLMARAQGFMSYTPEDIFDILQAVHRRPEYDEICESGKVLKQFDDKYAIFHQQFKSQFGLVSARDFVIISKTYIEGDTWFCVGRSIDGIIEPIKDVIRGELYIAGWVLKRVEGGTQCVFISWGDPKGNIPVSILNLGATNKAKVIEKVKQLLDKDKARK